MKTGLALFLLALCMITNLGSASSDPIDNLQGQLTKKSFLHLNPLYGGKYCGSGWSELLIPDSYIFSGGCVRFTKPCANHDSCYTRQKGKLFCDQQFYKELKQVCLRTFPKKAHPCYRECMELAKTYYLTVRKYGSSHYRSHRQLR